LRKATPSKLGEVSNLSEVTGEGKMGFLRGSRGGMLGKNTEGTWESLPYHPEMYRDKTCAYNRKREGARRMGRQSEEFIVAWILRKNNLRVAKGLCFNWYF